MKAPTFIKMDVEGYEKEVINGAKESISAFTPKMAVCVYHIPGDFWRLPFQIEEINNNYCFELIHFRQSEYTDTILLCIPKTAYSDAKNYVPSSDTVLKRLFELTKVDHLIFDTELDIIRSKIDFEAWLKVRLNKELERVKWLENELETASAIIDKLS